MRELEYCLKKEEIEESLLSLDYKREGKLKYVNVTLISVIALYCMITYLRQPENFILAALTVCCILILFVIIYLPIILRMRKAHRIYSNGNRYKVMLPKCEMVKAFESDHVFTIRTKFETYCIPKRILNKEEEVHVRTNIVKNAKKVLTIHTGRGLENGK